LEKKSKFAQCGVRNLLGYFRSTFFKEILMADDRKTETGQMAKPAPAAPPLGQEQLSVLEQILSGKTVKESAAMAGVSRNTVYRWLKSDPEFRAAYNRWHDEMEESSRSKLRMMTDLAAGTLRAGLEKGDARLALQLLKGLGLVRPEGERLLDAADVKMRAELDEKKRRVGMKEESRKIDSAAKQARGFDRLAEEMLEGMKG
jgi:AcrR family transcriptional regulator